MRSEEPDEGLHRGGGVRDDPGGHLGPDAVGASAVSHDLYASVFRHGRVDEGAELQVSRITTVVLGIVAIILGVLFEKVNVAFMVGLAFAVAASANFPVLLLAMLWKGLAIRAIADRHRR